MIQRLKFAIFHMPPKYLLRYAPIVAVIAVMPLLPLAYFTSRNPIYCGNCHKKSHEPELWRQSEVHPNSVTCIDCHATSRGFILRNFSAQPSRINPNCLRCHKLEEVKKIGSPGYKFKKNKSNVRIPHELHVEQVGASCTDCHYNLVHDRREHKTNRPPMEGCLSKCHASDAKNCRKCHPAGTVAPPITRTLETNTCRDCHGDFLNMPLSFAGREYHHAKHIQNGILCGNCHSNATKHGQMLITSADCDRCHTLKKPATHTTSWRKAHGKVAKANDTTCETCHQDRFCDACHGIQMPHKVNWRKEHAAAGVSSANVCDQCHTRDSCRACHMNMDRSPHDSGWRSSHGITAKASQKPCANCHQNKFCADCHGIPMPHPTQWITGHGKAAMSDARVCSRCHETGKKNDCATCHRSMKPAFHTANYTKTHPDMAKQKLDLCYLCHSKAGCNNCHKTPMPHEKDWALSHGSKGASFAANSFCYNCHKKQYCGACHELGE
ncbi:MAG: hypothetical protein HYX78_06640 [Armatimonadetes bacterium]|nr:hypothetical protein [Armatimonadota bacterium]